ncbi:protein MGARP isoform X3 [Excalfactoria chinensis]|uniref:protein MGARP isoform X3 n=1 Tax=Excalfactoria chinensis TaxID=46218 RepID=UPI003B3BC8F1
MYLCRAASQALAARLSRAPSAASRLKQRAPLRQMSSGSVPGSSGENMIYYLITGVAAFGTLFYTYKVVSSSRSNYIEHVNVLHERGQKHKAGSYKEGDEEETAEVTGADVATEEADTATAAGPAAQEESSGVTPETGGEGDLPAADTSTAVEGAQQEAAANSEAPAVQASSTHEENLDSVKEEVASAAQEMSDAAARNQDADADAEESGRASEGAGVQLVSEEEKAPEEVAEEP